MQLNSATRADDVWFMRLTADMCEEWLELANVGSEKYVIDDSYVFLCLREYG